jgi:hypothetical protein
MIPRTLPQVAAQIRTRRTEPPALFPNAEQGAFRGPLLAESTTKNQYQTGGKQFRISGLILLSTERSAVGTASSLQLIVFTVYGLLLQVVFLWENQRV